jgi:hypothetical protein
MRHLAAAGLAESDDVAFLDELDRIKGHPTYPWG